MSPTIDLRVAELLASRLCHDMISPVGAVKTGVELFTEYGLRIKARSKAVQTFVVQLCCDHSSYLPTAVATQGGGYSVDRGVGPEGGQALVDKTVEVIDTMWSESK